MDTASLAALQQSSAQLVQEVGTYVYDEWLKDHTVSYKDARDAATEVDVAAENKLRKKLSELLPEAGFIVEEGVSEEKPTYNWIIDPLDQTKKYVGKLPLFFVQMGLLDADGNCILGHIYNPVSKQLFSASKGNGAQLNGEPLTAPVRTDMQEAIIDINFSGGTDMEWKLKKLRRLAETFYRVQISADAFGPYILTGAIDCSVALADFKSPVDILPRVIVMQEAGLTVEYTELDGRKIWIIANPELFKKTRELLFA